MKIERRFSVTRLKRRWLLIGLAATLSLIIFVVNGLQDKALARDKSKLLVKAVVVTMFEVGDDTGDGPGEFQYWVERESLNKVYPLPAAYHDVRTNGEGLNRDCYW